MKSLTKKEIQTLIGFGNSHTFPLPDIPMGVTKFQVFLSIRPLLSGANYWYALRIAYQGSDNLFDYRSDLRWAFNVEQPDRDQLMTAKEKAYLDKLPDQVIIYRGMSKSELESGNFGLSWSLKKAVAEDHAYKYQRNYNIKKGQTTVHSITIPKNQIIAYFDGREEAEVIVPSNKMTINRALTTADLWKLKELMTEGETLSLAEAIKIINT